MIEKTAEFFKEEKFQNFQDSTLIMKFGGRSLFEGVSAKLLHDH